MQLNVTRGGVGRKPSASKLMAMGKKAGKRKRGSGGVKLSLNETTPKKDPAYIDALQPNERPNSQTKYTIFSAFVA